MIYILEYEVDLYEKIYGKVPVLDLILDLNPKNRLKYTGK